MRRPTPKGKGKELGQQIKVVGQGRPIQELDMEKKWLE